MTVANIFFLYPFGTAGDLTAVPDPTQGSGSVSYQSGFTINYQQQLGTVSSALPINRAQFNQILNDVTSGIQQYQTEGTYQYIRPVQNLSAPYPYDIYARVRYDIASPGTEGGANVVYVNQVQGNMVAPGVDATWIPERQSNYVADTGAVNALVADCIPAYSAYYPGMTLQVDVAHANTGATTINVNGLGIKDITILFANTFHACIGGELVPGIATLIYNGTIFQLTNPASKPVAFSSLKMSVPQTIPPGGASTLVEFDTVLRGDPYGIIVSAGSPTYSLTAMVSGPYLFTSTLFMEHTGGSAEEGYVDVYKNGTALLRFGGEGPIAGDDLTNSLSTVIPLIAGDVIQVYAHDTSNAPSAAGPVSDATQDSFVLTYLG